MFVPHDVHTLAAVAPTIALYVPARHEVHSVKPVLAPYFPALQVVQVVPPAVEYVPTTQEVEPVAPTRASCVTGPVADQAVEVSIRPLYKEW